MSFLKDRRKRVDFLLSILAWALLSLVFSWAVQPERVKDPCRCGSICSPTENCGLRSCPPSGRERTKGELIDLQREYAYYNTTYFEGRLPRGTGVEYGDPDLNLAPKVARATLLHEVYVLLWGKEFESHGKRFRIEMRRLVAAGAFEDLL